MSLASSKVLQRLMSQNAENAEKEPSSTVYPPSPKPSQSTNKVFFNTPTPTTNSHVDLLEMIKGVIIEQTANIDARLTLIQESFQVNWIVKSSHSSKR